VRNEVAGEGDLEDLMLSQTAFKVEGNRHTPHGGRDPLEGRTEARRRKQHWGVQRSTQKTRKNPRRTKKRLKEYEKASTQKFTKKIRGQGGGIKKGRNDIFLS